MKKAQKDLNNLERKYRNRTDQERTKPKFALHPEYLGCCESCKACQQSCPNKRTRYRF